MPPPSPANIIRFPSRLIRWSSIFLVSRGVAREWISVVSIALGLLAGLAFFFTQFVPQEYVLACWITAIVCCSIRIFSSKVEGVIFRMFAREKGLLQEESFTVLPERVSDAVTLIGFGFALSSNYWLGLAAALFAIFSAYIRFTGNARSLSSKDPIPRGPMNRVARLILMILASLLVICGFTRESTGISVPAITLWVIVFGCVATIVIRWLHVKNLRK